MINKKNVEYLQQIKNNIIIENSTHCPIFSWLQNRSTPYICHNVKFTFGLEWKHQLCNNSSIDSVTQLVNFLRCSKRGPDVDGTGADVDEQRKIAEGADALLNLAGVSTTHCRSRTPQLQQPIVTTPTKMESPSKPKRRSTTVDFSNPQDKRRRRWREWNEGNRYLKQVRG